MSDGSVNLRKCGKDGRLSRTREGHQILERLKAQNYLSGVDEVMHEEKRDEREIVVVNA